jgi:urea transport system substrate-binding protein
MTMPSIPVGILCSQSGPYQAMGREILKSALMAVDEINDSPDFDFTITAHVRDPRGIVAEYHTACDDLIRNTDVNHIIGCYTSASRKQVLPIVERTDRLLWYPARYEGFECSDNVIYVGASPNHNALPLVRFVLDNISRHIFCVGSNYVWTWETNRVTRELVTAAQGSILAERLLELGESAVEHIVSEIVRRRPPAVFNTLVGSSSYEFIRAFHSAAAAAALDIPMLSCSLCEPELKLVGPASAGCITSSAYFESIQLPENRAFVARWKARYGETSSPSVDGQSAYVAVYLLARAIHRAGCACRKSNPDIFVVQSAED